MRTAVGNADDWGTFRTASALIGLACILHGTKNGNWATLHTLGVLLGIIVTIGPPL